MVENEIPSRSKPGRKKRLPPGARFRQARLMSNVKMLEEICEMVWWLYGKDELTNRNVECMLGFAQNVFMDAKANAEVLAELTEVPWKKVAEVESAEEADQILAQTCHSYRVWVGSK